MKKNFILLLTSIVVFHTNSFAQFTSDSIQFWVGTGAHSAILTVDFVVDDVPSSYAWGVRFDSTITGGQMLQEVAAADEQFTVNAGDFLSDIFYVDFAGVGGNPTYWSTWTKMHDGDAWSTNLGLGTSVENGHWFGCSYTLYDDMFNPIDEPGNPLAAVNNNYSPGPFAPGADEIGSTAIPSDSNLFTGWATACEVVRGSIDASDMDAVDASHGLESDALGMPDGSSVVSLGDGGSAILTFAQPVMNGEGYDFAVFENGFGNQFLELAFVEVSSDGINFYRFDATSLTPVDEQVGGFGELDPTYIHNLAGKYRANFGTPFDLEELTGIAGLDVNAITHIKIVDVVGSIDPQLGSADASGNMINDPFPTAFASAGFDLDGVGVIHSSVSIEENWQATLNFYPNPASDYIVFDDYPQGELTIYNASRQVCFNGLIHSSKEVVDISRLSTGMYAIKLVSNNQVFNSTLIVK